MITTALVTLIGGYFQCGAAAPLADIGVQINGTPITTTMVVDNVNNIEFVNNANAECANLTNPLVIEATSVDELPQVDGLYNQPDLVELFSLLEDGEAIRLYEFGTDVPEEGDWQDMILIVNYNTIYAD